MPRPARRAQGAQAGAWSTYVELKGADRPNEYRTDYLAFVAGL